MIKLSKKVLLTYAKRVDLLCVDQVLVLVQEATGSILIGFLPELGVLVQSVDVPVD